MKGKDIWTVTRKQKIEEDYNKAIEPYEKMGFEPWDEAQWKLFGLLLIALIPAFGGRIVSIYLS